MSGIRQVDAPEPQVLPTLYYVGLFLALAGLTLTAVALSFLELGPFNISVSMAIAVTMATIIGAASLDFVFNSKVHVAILNVALVLVSVFLAMSIMDTSSRADVDVARRNFLPRDQAVAAQHEKDPNQELRAFKDSGLKVRPLSELTNPDVAD